jgi:predicted nucleotidyltransferase
MERRLMGRDERVVELLRKERLKLAYLFGSAAKGGEGRLSDLDLGVLLDESLSREERFRLQLRLTGELTSLLKTDRIDLVAMNDASLSLNYEIIAANHPLFARDEGQKIDFEHGILSRYLDRRYFEKRWAAEFLKKVAERGI